MVEPALVEPENQKQRTLLEALCNNNISLVGVFGPTGTGKSLLSLSCGIAQVSGGVFGRLVVSKPIAVYEHGSAGESSISPQYYKEQVIDYMRDLTSAFPDMHEKLSVLLEQGRVEIVDPYHLRGRSFDNSYILLDDAQNLEADAVVEAVTRLGRNSKLVIVGDPILQSSNPDNGAVLGRDVLREEEEAVVIDFGLKDIVRPGARRGVRLLFELRLRRRSLNSDEEHIRNLLRVYAPDADIITVVSLVELKKKYNITQDHVPDAVVIVKKGHAARTIGVKGERIGRVEEETGLTLRVVELTLDLREYVRAVHPVAWLHSKIIDIDLEGTDVVAYVSKEHLGPAIGQKGVYARFMNDFFKTILGAGFLVREAIPHKKARRERKRTR